MLAQCLQDFLQVGKSAAWHVYQVPLLQLAELGFAGSPLFLFVGEAAQLRRQVLGGVYDLAEDAAAHLQDWLVALSSTIEFQLSQGTFNGSVDVQVVVLLAAKSHNSDHVVPHLWNVLVPVAQQIDDLLAVRQSLRENMAGCSGNKLTLYECELAGLDLAG